MVKRKSPRLEESSQSGDISLMSDMPMCSHRAVLRARELVKLSACYLFKGSFESDLKSCYLYVRYYRLSHGRVGALDEDYIYRRRLLILRNRYLGKHISFSKWRTGKECLGA